MRRYAVKRIDRAGKSCYAAHMSSVASVLRDGRAALGISQRRLAELMGIASSFLNDIEHGRRTLGEKYLDGLPAELRIAVTAAIIAHKQAEIAALRKGAHGWGTAMSDTEAGEARRAVQAILVEDLTTVTAAMLEAGSQALMARNTSEGEQLAAVWRAMLRVKLAGPA